MHPLSLPQSNTILKFTKKLDNSNPSIRGGRLFILLYVSYVPEKLFLIRILAVECTLSVSPPSSFSAAFDCSFDVSLVSGACQHINRGMVVWLLTR